MIKIQSFDFDENLVNQFIDFSWKIYENDQNWNAPSKETLKLQLSPSFPFYNHGQIKNFLAFDESNKVVGRVSAMINHRLKIDGEQIGHVGFFECIEDYDVAKALLDQGIQYLRSCGINKVWGPLNFATLHTYRFVTKGFEKPTFYSDLYNPPYYPIFFEKYGFKILKNYYSNLCLDIKAVYNRYAKFKKRFDELGFTTRKINLDDFDNELKLFYDLLFGSFSNNYAFTSLDYDEFLFIYGKYNKLIKPEQFMFAYSPDNKPVGFFLAYPDLTGNHKKAFLTKLMGVLPEYAYAGVGMALVYDIFGYYINEGYDYCVAPLRIEGNSSMKFGKGIYTDFKEYALYELFI